MTAEARRPWGGREVPCLYHINGVYGIHLGGWQDGERNYQLPGLKPGH